MKYFTQPPIGSQLELSHSLNHGLVCYLPCHEKSGVIAQDLSIYKNRGIFYNVVPSSTSGWTGGKFGSSISFDGTNDYVEAIHSSSLSLTSKGTLAAWINIRNIITFCQIIGKRSAGSAAGLSYIIDLSSSGDKIRGLISNGSTINIITSSTAMLTNKWYFIVFTWNGSSLNVFLNGIKDATSVSQTVNAQVNSGHQLGIGIAADSSPLYFNGLMSELRVYNRALSEVEISQLYYDPFCMFENKNISRYLNEWYRKGSFFFSRL